jgi:nitroimidazol reductase NimA-like FMN-containing flavoprotein (pyridoxamine 5'-phosphate oxidase superfamily)
MRAKVRGVMPREQLYQRIADFLASQSMCVLATSNQAGVPRASPVEYYAEGVNLYMTVDPGVKVENLKGNPRISVGVCNSIRPEWKNGIDWATVKSAQITGEVKFLVEGTPEFAHALKVYKYWIFAEACGLDPKLIIAGRPFLKVETKKVEYMEFNLKSLGFGSRQVWEASASN